MLALAYFPDPGQGLTEIFTALAGVMLLTVPLAFMIPDTARERHQAQRAAEQAEAGSAESRPVPTRP